MNVVTEQQLTIDIASIQSLDIVPTILDIVCNATGMGFAAVARVTDQRWIACAVKDEIGFGLVPGSELQIATTICNEIRSHGRPVLIDEVATDEHFCGHHTPEMYGFQSYISMPIYLKSGEFFGTLCAIDPAPFPLKAGNAEAMFSLFADLIAFHLQAREALQAQHSLLEVTQHQLETSLDDIRQFAHVGRHVLQEPLRKLQVFSDMIIQDGSLPPDHKAIGLAGKINSIAKDFSSIVHELTDYTDSEEISEEFEVVDLNDIAESVVGKLQLKIRERNAIIQLEPLHHIFGVPGQINRAFYQLLNNALQFVRPGIRPLIRVYSAAVDKAALLALGFPVTREAYCKISFEDNGLGIKAAHLDRIFDLFVRLHGKDAHAGLGVGLSQAKKIMNHHHGLIVVNSEEGKGSTFSLISYR